MLRGSRLCTKLEKKQKEVQGCENVLARMLPAIRKGMLDSDTLGRPGVTLLATLRGAVLAQAQRVPGQGWLWKQVDLRLAV